MEEHEPLEAEETPQGDVAEEGTAEAPQPFVPPKVTTLRPSAIHVERFADGSAQVEFMVPPLEVYAIQMPPEATSALSRELTGGIEIARAIPRMDVPKGRGR